MPGLVSRRCLSISALRFRRFSFLCLHTLPWEAVLLFLFKRKVRFHTFKTEQRNLGMMGKRLQSLEPFQVKPSAY